MCQKSISISYKEYFSNEGLDLNDRVLLDRAKEASEGAYAPYSNFHVGAAVRLSNGEIIAASNQENAAFPSGLCAERVAILYAHAKFPGASVESIAVTASAGGKMCETPTYPCGACRQVLAESEMRSGNPIRVIIGGEKLTQTMESISVLLPFTFDNLPKR